MVTSNQIKMVKYTRKQLREIFSIKSVGGGVYGEGFYDCLRAFTENNLDIFKIEHTIKRIKFAKKNNLPYHWLILQLQNDYKRKIGLKNNIFSKQNKSDRDKQNE